MYWLARADGLRTVLPSMHRHRKVVPLVTANLLVSTHTVSLLL